MSVRIDGLRIRYARGGPPALAIDALRVPRGQRVAVIGPSGSGKTTLLRALHGLARPEAGEIAVHGVVLGGGPARSRRFRRRSAAVFQEFQLVERASVLRNVLCGRLGRTPTLASLLGAFSREDLAAARRALAATGLDGLAARRADALSGGQRQRVAIARALAQDPELLTADEPVSQLDPLLAGEMLSLVMGAARERAVTVLAVVHDPARAAAHSGRVLGLAGGRLVYDSAVDGPLQARALRRIYGRGPPPRIVRETISPEPAHDAGHPPSHVA